LKKNSWLFFENLEVLYTIVESARDVPYKGYKFARINFAGTRERCFQRSTGRLIATYHLKGSRFNLLNFFSWLFVDLEVYYMYIFVAIFLAYKKRVLRIYFRIFSLQNVKFQLFFSFSILINWNFFYFSFEFINSKNVRLSSTIMWNAMKCHEMTWKWRKRKYF
jgi:hypothetical protein